MLMPIQVGGMEIFMDNVSLLWLLAMIILFVIEGITLNLTTIWFAIGSAAGFILSMTGFSQTTQICTFLAISFVLFIFTKPFIEKKLKVQKQPTNCDMLIGCEAVVTKDISPEEFAGEIKVKGRIWSAVSADSSPICAGDKVRIISIDGVKLVVEKER